MAKPTTEVAQNVEAHLISAVVRTGEYQVLAEQGMTPLMFHTHDEEYAWVERYIARHGKAPSKSALRQQYPDFVISKSVDPLHWCDQVRTEHRRQSLLDLMDSSMELLDHDDVERAVAHFHDGLATIEATSGGLNADFDVFEQWPEVFESVADKVDRVRVTGWAGIPTAFRTLDDITGGLQGGWFGVVAARLGQGKTWTGVRMAYSAAVTHHTVLYFSLEQSKLQIATRVHAFGSRQFAKNPFNPLDLNRGRGFDLREYKKFLQEMQARRGSGRFLINDTSRGMVTPASISASIARTQPDIVFIDYLTLLGTTTDDWRGTAKLSAELQSIAQRYNIPIVALSQVNRLGIGQEPPGAEHLSQADAIGQDADIVLTMAQKSKSVMKMKLAKFRHGPGGDTWYARFSPGTGEYEEIGEDEASQQMSDDQDED